MRLLLDTHTVVWSILRVEQLSHTARAAIESFDNDLYVSVASIWEMAIKAGLQK